VERPLILSGFNSYIDRKLFKAVKLICAVKCSGVSLVECGSRNAECGKTYFALRGADLARPSVRPRPRRRCTFFDFEDEDEDDWSTFDFAT
jgi:hypothetical protein